MRSRFSWFHYSTIMFQRTGTIYKLSESLWRWSLSASPSFSCPRAYGHYILFRRRMIPHTFRKWGYLWRGFWESTDCQMWGFFLGLILRLCSNTTEPFIWCGVVALAMGLNLIFQTTAHNLKRDQEVFKVNSSRSPPSKMTKKTIFLPWPRLAIGKLQIRKKDNPNTSLGTTSNSMPLSSWVSYGWHIFSCPTHWHSIPSKDSSWSRLCVTLKLWRQSTV